MDIERIRLTITHNPKGVALFVRRANILLGTEYTSAFAAAGHIGREYVGGDNDAAVLLFCACNDAGSSRARRTTRWGLLPL